jgi:diguanylate cyclase
MSNLGLRKKNPLHDNNEVEKFNLINDEIILENFIFKIISFLKKNKIPVTPLNIFLNYEKILEEQGLEEKSILNNYIIIKEKNENLSIESEKNFKNGFEHIKNILKTTSGLYQNIQFMKKNSSENYEKINKSTNISEIKERIELFNNEINKFSKLMEIKLNDIKTFYNSGVVVLNEVKNNSIYDDFYDIFNKNYLMSSLRSEIINIEKFNYNSCLMAIRMNENLCESIKNEKTIKIINKNLIKSIIKTSRRSDIIAHYENGIFLILLQQTDMEHSFQAGIRIKEMLENSNFFFDNIEINIKISISLFNIEKNEPTEVIEKVLMGLNNYKEEEKIKIV